MNVPGALGLCTSFCACVVPEPLYTRDMTLDTRYIMRWPTSPWTWFRHYATLNLPPRLQHVLQAGLHCSASVTRTAWGQNCHKDFLHEQDFLHQQVELFERDASPSSCISLLPCVPVFLGGHLQHTFVYNQPVFGTPHTPYSHHVAQKYQEDIAVPVKQVLSLPRSSMTFLPSLPWAHHHHCHSPANQVHFPLPHHLYVPVHQLLAASQTSKERKQL